MSKAPGPRMLPMQVAGTQHFIERTYRESGPFQWVRETYKNAQEANATRIQYGIEWQAVRSHGVYRRTISDNGSAMEPEKLVEFFNTFGGGGKPIGGIHENFGVGAKTSLLPWNRYGVVVVSWVDGEPAMIWVQRDPETGEYGLKLQEVVDEDTGEVTLDEVFAPYQDEEHGCDWEAVKPEWIEEHGTVLVLLGNKPTDDSVLGDPDRREGDIKGVSTYLNRRLWEIPDRVEVYVDELRTQDRAQWPESADTARGARPTGGAGRRSNMRQIRGARYYIEYPGPATKTGALAHSGTVPLPDATQVDWYLWKGERPAVQSYAAVGGYIGALYENELYDVTSHQATYRSFGVTERDVRSRLWLIIRPPAYDEQNGKHGVYPRTDRNALLLKGGPSAGGPLPINDWAAQFADRMPAPLLAAIRKARADGHGTITDKTWRERLAERFGTRWQIPKLRVRKDGALTVESIQPGSLPTRIRRVKRLHPITGGGNGGGRRGEPNTGSFPGAKSAVRAKLAGGLPNYRLVGADQVDSGMLAAWHPNDPTEPAGVVLVNIEHPVLEAELEHWQSQYPDHLAEEVGDEVRRVYGEIAVAKVAHSEHLKGVIPSKRVDDDLRSEAALTMALLGLIGEEAVIAPRIGGKFRKRREAALAIGRRMARG